MLYLGVKPVEDRERERERESEREGERERERRMEGAAGRLSGKGDGYIAGSVIFISLGNISKKRLQLNVNLLLNKYILCALNYNAMITVFNFTTNFASIAY